MALLGLVLFVAGLITVGHGHGHDHDLLWLSRNWG